MTDTRVEREFKVSPEKLFRFISGATELVSWFGPEGVRVPDNALDFTREGPWYAVMANDDGPFAKVSGQVTHVDPPRSVGFTWGWHDDEDKRGPESHVTFTVEPTTSGAKLVIDHRDLPDDDAATRHNSGWISSLKSLDAVL